MGFWIPPKLWKSEVNKITSVYPGAQWSDIIDEGHQTRAWLLTMDPVPDKDELPLILHDLDNGIGISIGHRGKIHHSGEQCVVSLKQHAKLYNGLKLEPFIYLVEFIHRRPDIDTVGPTQPKARILSPEISTRKYQNHPHMYIGTRNDSWACPLSPQHSDWAYGDNATVEYLDQLSIWLLKSTLWIATGGGILSFGTWIGPDTSHKPIDLLSTIHAVDPCWCGSGRSYEKCHSRNDVNIAIIQQVIKH